MASKYTLNELPTSGSVTYRGTEYPIWDVDGLPVSTNALYYAIGGDGHLNDDAKEVEDKCVVYTDATKPIDEICAIASQQGGSGTPEKIIADTEKRIKLFNDLVLALARWHTGADGMDGATGEIWDCIPMSIVPNSTDYDWHKDDLCGVVDQYIGSRHDLTPEVTIDDLFIGNVDAVKRLHEWARKRAQDIYDGGRKIGEELNERHKREELERIAKAKEEEDKRNKQGEAVFGTTLFVLYRLDCGTRGYYYTLDDKNAINQFFDDEDKIVSVYQRFSDDYETYFSEISIAEATEIALAVENYLNRKEAR